VKRRLTRIVLVTAGLAGLALSAEREGGSICVAPAPEKPDPRSAPGLFCNPEKLSLRIDETTMEWPTKESAKIGTLNITARHRLVVLCDGKPQQSFGFRFSEFKSTELCVFLNDLYKTVQLWEVKRCPWCNCK